MPAGKTVSTLESLIENLQDANQVVRIYAATVLGSMGEDAEAAVPALVELLQTGDVQDRRLAALTLGEIASEDAISALCDAVDDDDAGVAEMAGWALGQIDGEEEQAEAA
jgi:HEAT repeat protein